MDFSFETIGVHRLEARAAVQNGRGNGALRKVGAVQEGVLRKSFLRDGEYLDQVLWTIVDEDWRQAKVVQAPRSTRNERTSLPQLPHTPSLERLAARPAARRSVFPAGPGARAAIDKPPGPH